MLNRLLAVQPSPVMIGIPVAMKSAAIGGPRNKMDRKTMYGQRGQRCNCVVVCVACMLLEVSFEACICDDE